MLSAFADVEKALVALQQDTLQEKLQNDVVTNSREAFDVAETQLRDGAVNLITVLQTSRHCSRRRTPWCRCVWAKLQAAPACSRRWAAALVAGQDAGRAAALQ